MLRDFFFSKKYLTFFRWSAGPKIKPTNIHLAGNKKRQFELFFTFSASTDEDNFTSLLASAHTHNTRTGPHKHKHTHTCYRLTPLDKSRREHLAAVEVRVNRWRLNPRWRYKQLDKSQSIAAIATATAQYFLGRHSLGFGNSFSIYLCCDKPVEECVCTHMNTPALI